MFSELDELSGGREGGASTQAPDDVLLVSPWLSFRSVCFSFDGLAVGRVVGVCWCGFCVIPEFERLR